ncbi:Mth938-like domain-containing protein [Thiothrix subterranea]|uniref:Mth938-like domain-containing protein n=1 Tax=Thiothrix subterranea TaxID=2735563 RepID=A0ABU0YDR4_9GAMM|nr:Mth938-like domain-containing protein [Thiothrix subterranea]MDQ5769837.1 Mth938-like domain-containing protein [Thiothrix subterranea]
MKFSEELNSAHYRITGYGDTWVAVNQNPLSNSFLIGSQTLITDWQPQSIQALQPAHLEPLFAIGAEVILIGTGKNQQFPSPDLWKVLVQNGVGFEVMTTAAACRTYNVLLSEARRVAAAFFLT